AAGHIAVADHVGVADRWPHVFHADAKRLGQLHGDRRARAADVSTALDQADAAVGIDAGAAAGFQTDVEPEARGDAAATLAPRAFAEGRRVVRVLPGRLDRLDHADA